MEIKQRHDTESNGTTIEISIRLVLAFLAASSCLCRALLRIFCIKSFFKNVHLAIAPNDFHPVTFSGRFSLSQ